MKNSPVFQRSFSTTSVGFSFTRSNRFISGSESPGFYCFPSTLSTTSAVFGTAKRPEFIKESDSPGPCHYSPTHSPDTNGKTISKSNLNNRLKLTPNKSPGPGSYNIDRDLKGPKYTFPKSTIFTSSEGNSSGAGFNHKYSFASNKQYSKVVAGTKNKARKKVIGPVTVNDNLKNFKHLPQLRNSAKLQIISHHKSNSSFN